MKNKDIESFYNDNVNSLFGDKYEFHRWFETAEKRSGFFQTKKTLEKIIHKFMQQTDKKTLLELGPGGGTWTNLFVESKKYNTLDLVDISSYMLSLSERRFKNVDYITYTLSDFVQFCPSRTYDMFFSSRVLEYFEDKKCFFNKVAEVLNSEGLGVVVTKAPQYWRKSLFKKHTDGVHSGQISPHQFSLYLKQAGFSIVKVYPTTFVFPKLHNGLLNNILYFLLQFLPVAIVYPFLESYTVVFKKV